MDLQIYDYIIVFGLAIATFALLDLAWLGYFAKDFYNKQLKVHLAKDFNKLAAGLFYPGFIIGLMSLAIIPAINQDSLGIAMFRGLAYGLFTYWTYDMTNLATLKNWPKKIVVVDILWGAFISFATATITYSMYWVVIQ